MMNQIMVGKPVVAHQATEKQTNLETSSLIFFYCQLLLTEKIYLQFICPEWEK
jgi:hypothetical protein